MKKILFICTSNKDRSPALQNYFAKLYPHNQYRSAGINKYFCTTKGTHYLTQEDIDWAQYVICCEDIHKTKAVQITKPLPRWTDEDIDKMHGGAGSLRQRLRFGVEENYKANFIVLGLGEYKQGCIGEDYLTKAEEKIKHILTNNENGN